MEVGVVRLSLICLPVVDSALLHPDYIGKLVLVEPLRLS